MFKNILNHDLAENSFEKRLSIGVETDSSALFEQHECTFLQHLDARLVCKDPKLAPLQSMQSFGNYIFARIQSIPSGFAFFVFDMWIIQPAHQEFKGFDIILRKFYGLHSGLLETSFESASKEWNLVAHQPFTT